MRVTDSGEPLDKIVIRGKDGLDIALCLGYDGKTHMNIRHYIPPSVVWQHPKKIESARKMLTKAEYRASQLGLLGRDFIELVEEIIDKKEKADIVVIKGDQAMKDKVFKDLDDLVLKHGLRAVADAAFHKLLEPAVDQLAKDLPESLKLLGEPAAGLVKGYLEQTLKKLDDKIDPSGAS